MPDSISPEINIYPLIVSLAETMGRSGSILSRISCIHNAVKGSSPSAVQEEKPPGLKEGSLSEISRIITQTENTLAEIEAIISSLEESLLSPDEKPKKREMPIESEADYVARRMNQGKGGVTLERR